MNKKTRIYCGFSMVEMMLLLVIVSLMLASGVTVISKKHVKVPRLASHGAYICYINKAGNLHQEKYLGIGLENKIMDEDTDQCVFVPPARAAYLHIQATGGGGGGGASGYKGGTLFRYQSKTEVISPFGWTDDILKLKGMTLNELQTYGGKVWAYADGTGDFGDGGDGGDVYYIRQDCANDACLVYRTWINNGNKERICDCDSHTEYSNVVRKTYQYYSTRYSSSTYTCRNNRYSHDYYCITDETESSYKSYSSSAPSGSGWYCDSTSNTYCYSKSSCSSYASYGSDPNKSFTCLTTNSDGDCTYGRLNYCSRYERKTGECAYCRYDVVNTSTCENETHVPVDATCSESNYQMISVDATITEAQEVAQDSHYRIETTTGPYWQDGDDVEEREVLRDTGTAQTVCNYGSNQIYTGTGIFGSFMAGEIPGVTCDNSSLSAAFGEQMVSMGTNTTSVHSTKTGKVSEFYDVEAGGTDEKFPMFLKTEKLGGNLSTAFGDSCVNTYNGTCESNSYHGDFTDPFGDKYKAQENLPTSCNMKSSVTYKDGDQECDDAQNDSDFIKFTSSTSYSRPYYNTVYKCQCVVNHSVGDGCVYDYTKVTEKSDPQKEFTCSYIPDVVSGGTGGKGKFCALNDITVTTGLNYKGESSIIAGIRGSDRLLTGAGYKPLYTKNEWEHQDAGYAENGTPSQGFAEIRITGGGGDSWCELHKEKVPGRGQGARRETTGSAIPVEGKDAPYAGGNEATVGSINGAGYSENAGKKCGDNHVGFCLKASGNSNAIRENGKYTYNYTWNTNYLQYGEGGDAGEYRVKIIRAFKDKDIEITLGRGGAAGSHPPDGSTDRTICNGQDGGDTIVGDILTAKGGKGGEGCIPTVTEQLPYWYEGGVFRAEQPGTNGKLASVTNYKSNILNLVLPVDNTVLGAWIAASGAGGNGGGSFNNCWASEWVRTFEGKPITERYGPLDANQLETQGCRQGTYWGHTPDPEAGTSGVVLIKW